MFSDLFTVGRNDFRVVALWSDNVLQHDTDYLSPSVEEDGQMGFVSRCLIVLSVNLNSLLRALSYM